MSNVGLPNNYTALTFPGHDPEAWVCCRCGLIEPAPFPRWHRPATNPGIRTCGGVVVQARFYHQVVELLRKAWLAWVQNISDLESGKGSHRVDSGAYGLWQIL